MSEKLDHVDTPMEGVDTYTEKYRDAWADKDDAYWLERLVQEIGEAASVMAGDHDDSLEHEIRQIGSIAVNWLRIRRKRKEEAESVLPTPEDLANGCDCQAPYARPALISMECPVHNEDPSPPPDDSETRVEQGPLAAHDDPLEVLKEALLEIEMTPFKGSRCQWCGAPSRPDVGPTLHDLMCPRVIAHRARELAKKLTP